MAIKRLIILFALLACAIPSFAQTTSVSATAITDAGGVIWKNGTFNFQFVPSPVNPFGPYQQGGAPFNTSQVISGSLDGAGSFTQAVPDNKTISPAGSGWKFTLCPAATSPCSTFTFTITGASQVISVTPPAITISMTTPPPGASAYTDSEIIGARQGQFYWNLTDNTLHICQLPVCTWVSLITSITNPISGTPVAPQTITGQSLTLTSSAPLITQGTGSHSGVEGFTGPVTTQAFNDMLWVGPGSYSTIAAAVTAAGSNQSISPIRSTYAGTECPASTIATLTFWDFRGGSETCTQNSVSWNQTSASGLHTMARFIQTRNSPTNSDLALYGQSLVGGSLPTNQALDGVSGEVDTFGALSAAPAGLSLAGLEGTVVLNSTGQTIPAIHGGVFNMSSQPGNTTGFTNGYVIRAQQYVKGGSEIIANLYSFLCEGQTAATTDNYCMYHLGSDLYANNVNIDAVDSGNARQHIVTFTPGNLIIYRSLLDANGWTFRNQANSSDWLHCDSTHCYFYDSKLSVANNGQLQSTLPTGTPPVTVVSTTPVANLTAVPVTYNAAGTQVIGAHIAEDSGSLSSGTPSTATVVLAGSAAFTSNASYHCSVTNQTTQANPLKITYTDGSHFVVTGPNTVTDGFSFVCVGN